MSGECVIELRNVWKGFQRHTGQMLLRTHLKNWLGLHRKTEQFFALKDVSFQVQAGEGLAVIGANGAGKSTLLSLVAGLVPADTGTVSVTGRLATLLELGSGFHPDLTGAENVCLNAALLGISRSRMKHIFEDVVEFSELSDFMDEPLRTYSAGMTMRLAFSIATNVDPDILLVDEVLAVGDHAFRTKCLEKILDFRRSGKTIVCVSHDFETVQRVCDRAIWLDHGDLLLDGSMNEVIDAYHGRIQSQH
jgi:ABC-type polysaccharide/polyol phosphate transport system ATPase subunit